jgi:glyoxylase-like metal-dependent hydrolase (beta-lactamase superfamily II)
MIFRQLFDPETSTYSYLMGDADSREALLIDPVREQLERDTVLIGELGLTLRYVLETHVHADHVTSSGRLRQRCGGEIAVGQRAGVANADLVLAHGDTLHLGSCEIEALWTPGHTAGCCTYSCASAGMAFTGDTLLIRGCGRTDFQEGDPHLLFHSVREHIFGLPDETLLYPAHDYRGRTVTTVAEEKRFNPRLGLARSEEEFVEIMGGLNLAFPKRMEESVPANLKSGLADDGAPPRRAVAGVMEELGRQDADVWMGAGI